MRPPQHSATAPARFVALGDPAWDDRWVEESKTLPDEESHPVATYFSGRTRYDLDAYERITVGEEQKVATPRDYLKDDPAPVVWHLRRLRPKEFAKIADIGRNASESAALEAFAVGVVEVEGLEGFEDLEGPKTRRGRLTEDEVDALFDEVGGETVAEVGNAVFRASKAPRAAEKKR